MRSLFAAIVSAVVGAAGVSAAFWFAESVVPQGDVVIPFEIGRGVTVLAVLLVGAVLVDRGRAIYAAGFLAGSGLAWALHEAHPLSLCQSDVLYRPCTGTEVGSMMLPVVLLLVSAVVSAVVFARPRRSV